MRKGLIQWGLTSLVLGVYLFYHELVLSTLQQIPFLGWLTASPYVYAGIGLFLMFSSYLAGRMLTRGMN